MASESFDRASLAMNLENCKKLFGDYGKKDRNENGQADKCSCACYRADTDNEGSLAWRVFRKRMAEPILWVCLTSLVLWLV